MNILTIFIILLVGLFAVYFSGDKRAAKVAMLFSAASALFAVTLLVRFLGGADTSWSAAWIGSPPVKLSFRTDGLSIAMLLMSTILMTVIIGTRITHPEKREKEFYTLLMLSLFAIVGVFTSSNALVYYIFWELSLIPIYFIVIYWGNGDAAKRRNAAFTFFIYTFAGSLCMLVAFIYLYVLAGSFDLDALYSLQLTSREQSWIFLALFAAYAIKIPLFPFHTWQAAVYQKAPAAGTMILSALMSKMGLYSIIRWQLPVTPIAAQQLQPIVVTLCIFTVIYGTIIALRQDNLKRLLAFASLAHVGFIAAGIYALTLDGLNGAVLLIIAHAFGITGLFFGAEVIYRRLKTASISQMGGIRSHASRFGFFFLMMILSSIAIPLTFNFVGEFTIMYGLYQANAWYGVFMATSMFLSAFLMLRMFQYVMLGEPSQTFADIGRGEFLVFLSVTLVMLFFGVYSMPLTDLVSPVLNGIIHIFE